MNQVLVFMWCENNHNWAEAGTANEQGGVTFEGISAPGAPDDPTTCKQCGKPPVSISLLGAAKRHRTRRHAS